MDFSKVKKQKTTSAPGATPLSLNEPYCAVLLLTTTAPGTSELEPGLYKRGDLAMITFSTQESKPSVNCRGQRKL